MNLTRVSLMAGTVLAAYNVALGAYIYLYDGGTEAFIIYELMWLPILFGTAYLVKTDKE